MIPGPTNIDPSVLRVLAQPIDSFVCSKFIDVYRDALDDLKKVFMTKGQPLIISGTGTLGEDMALANIVQPGDQVLSIVCGFFGQRAVEMAACYNAKCTPLEYPIGKAVNLTELERILDEGDFKAVTITHVDTSTGVSNPIREVGKLVKDSGAFYIVDAVSSLGGIELKMDDWGIDICVSSSQKCLAAPPGLAIIALGKRVLDYLQDRKWVPPTFYGDFKNWLPVMENPSNYLSTPPINLICALGVALKNILEEGLDNRFKRHRLMAKVFQKSMNSINLKILAETACASETITAVYYPERIKDIEFRRILNDQNIRISGGYGPLAGKIFRVGHMGNVNANDMLSTISAIERGLAMLGYPFRVGDALTTAEEVLLGNS